MTAVEVICAGAKGLERVAGRAPPTEAADFKLYESPVVGENVNSKATNTLDIAVGQQHTDDLGVVVQDRDDEGCYLIKRRLVDIDGRVG